MTLHSLYLDLCNSRDPRFTNSITFFSQGFAVPEDTAAKALALQRIKDTIHRGQAQLGDDRKPTADKVTNVVEAIWQVVEETVRLCGGASAETKPPQKDSGAPSSAPSDDNCAKQESRSSMKRRATLSEYGQVGPIRVGSAKGQQLD